jgi:hypothetical protein
MTTKLRISYPSQSHFTLALGLLIVFPIEVSTLAPAGLANPVQGASPAPQASSTMPTLTGLRSGTKIEARLLATLDVLATKTGDVIAVQVTKDLKRKGRMAVHDGDRLVGRVISVQPQSVGKGQDDSEIAIAFDRLRSGTTTYRLNTVIHSVALLALQQGRKREETEEKEPTRGRGQGHREGGRASGMGGGRGVFGSSSSAGPGVGGPGEEIASPGDFPPRDAPPPESIKVRSLTAEEGRAGSVSVLRAHQGNLRLRAGTRLEFRTEGP